jgi:hypothetical protein
MIAQAIKTIWLILERANFTEKDLPELVFTTKNKETVVVC